MQTGDFDGDGHLDFADTQFDSTQIRVSFGDGTGKFPRAQHVETGRQYFALTTIDLQGDGLTDLVIDEGYGFQMARNTGNGFAPFEFVPLPFFAGRLESVDLNGDGYRDLLAAPGYSFNANQTQFTILPGLANGGFGESVTYSFPSFSVANPYLIDSNDDQRPELIVPTMNGFLLVPNFGATNPGDLNRDNEITPADIDLLCAAVVEGNSDVRFDLNQDAQVSTADVDYFLASIARTIPGDVNFDGVFNSSDLVSLFQIGKYEDGVPKNSRWSEGDFNCDGDFTTADFVMAFQIGGYSF
jgi:hypothetical protein